MMNQEQFFEENINLVHHTLKRYYPSFREEKVREPLMDTNSYDDLFQMGCVGLWKAIQKYDSSKSSFGNYAIITIRGEIQRYLNKTHKGFSVSSDIIKSVRFIEKTLKTEGESGIIKSEIMNRFKLSEKMYEDAYELALEGILFLDYQMENGDKISDTIPFHDNEFEMADIHEFMSHLTDDEQKVIKMTAEGYTLREIGKEIGCSGENIRLMRLKINNKAKESMQMA
jgi:RNA polymerase sigma factor (sigma-70 family)